MSTRDATQDAGGLETRRYTPAAGIHSLLRFLRSMATETFAVRELGWALCRRDIHARYRQSLLGIGWVLLNPIAFATIFILLHRYNVLTVEDTGVPYPVFLITGTVLWQLFTDSLWAPLKSVQANIPLLSKVAFPREILLVSAVGQVWVDFALKLPVVVLVFLLFGASPTPSGLLLVGPAALALSALGFTFGVLLTPIGTLYRDIGAALVPVTQFWFFLTPVVYPTPTEGTAAWLPYVNPVAPMLATARDLLFFGHIASPVLYVSVLTITFLVGVLALAAYRLSMPILIERMSA